MTNSMMAEPTGAALPAPEPPASFEDLLADVVGPAFGAALRLTGNREDAEDLVQDAALNAFRAFASFAAGTNFKAWFFRIMMNCFYTTQRRKRPVASMDELEDSHSLYLFVRTEEAGLHERGSNPARLLLDRLAAEDIARALESLPEEFRVVATLYFMEDFAYQEIADMLGIPVGTVRSRLHRGRRMLQKQLWKLAEDQGLVSGLSPGSTGE